MATVTELLAANLHDVFGNRDAVSRRAAVERIYSPDVVFTDPEGSASGWDAVERKAAELLDSVPSAFVFAEDGRRYASETTGALGWGFGPEGDPQVHGIDVIEVQDGVITSVRTFFSA